MPRIYIKPHFASVLLGALCSTVASTHAFVPVDQTPSQIASLTNAHLQLTLATHLYALRNTTPSFTPPPPATITELHSTVQLDIPTFQTSLDPTPSPWLMPLSNIPLFIAPPSVFISNHLCASLNQTVGIVSHPLPTQFNPIYPFQCYQSPSKSQNLIISYSGNPKLLQHPTADITNYIPISEITDFPNKHRLTHQKPHN